MAFPVKDWQNLPAGGTPINEASLEDLEARLAAYTDQKTPGTIQLGAASGSDDLATINAATLSASSATGSVVKGRIGETYKISGPIKVYSNMELDMTGCTVKFVTTSTRTNMLQNRAVTPIATGTATTTVGGSVVTTALASTAAIGNYLAVVGAGPSGGETAGRVWLYGRITAVNSGGGTVTLGGNVNGVAASVVVTGAVAYLFDRDSNITVTGGTWDGEDNWDLVADRIAANVDSHQLRLRRIDGLTVRNIRLKLQPFATGTKGWVFGINPGDVNDFLIENIWSEGASTTVQGDGPLSKGTINNVRGATQDDLIAFGTVSFSGNDVEGDITDIVVDGVESQNAYTAYKLFGGYGSNGVQRYLNNMTLRNLQGTTEQGCVQVINYANNGVTVDNLIIDNVSCVPGSGFVQTRLSGMHVGSVTVRNAVWPEGVGRATGATGLVYVERPVANLAVQDIVPRGPSGNAHAVVCGPNAGTCKSITIEGYYAPDTGVTSAAFYAGTTQTVDRLTIRRFRKISPGTLCDITGGGNVRDVIISDGRSDSTSAALVALQNNTISPNLKISDVYAAQTADAPIILAGPAQVYADAIESNTASPLCRVATAAATPVRIRASNLRLNSSQVIVTRDGTQSISVNTTEGTVDASILTPLDGDWVNNTNATLGAGLLIWTANQAGWGVGPRPVTKRVTADVSNSTTTLADITGLTGFTLAASSVYWIEFVGTYTTAAATTGLGLAINTAATITTLSLGVQIAESATATRNGVQTANNTAVQALDSLGATQLPFRVYGTIIVGASGGALAFRQVSEVAASAVTTKTGSVASVQRIA